MKKIILSVGVFLLAAATFQLQAQSISNKNWKAYLAEPFNDTLTLHIQSDSSFVTTSTGEVLVQSSCKITGDIFTLTDYSTTQYSCPDATGKYKIELSKDGNSLTFTLIEDACDGRAQALSGLKWVKASK
jgi:hypothetical protein